MAVNICCVRHYSEWRWYEDQKYHFMGGFSGTVHWSCPYCGHVQQTKMRRRTWRMRCAQSDCRRVTAFIFTLTPVGRERRKDVLPRDMALELAPVPITRTLGTGAAAPIHRRVDDLVNP
jgi:hypothetical protein